MTFRARMLDRWARGRTTPTGSALTTTTAREAAAAADRDDPPECRTDEVDFELAWHRGTTGMLTGDLVAANVSDRAWRL